MPFQIPLQLFARRPSPALVAISGSLVFLFFLLFQARPSPKTARLRGGVTLSSDCLEDILNRTLGVKSTPFEKIFVIGLPARTDRRDGIVLSAALTDLEVDFVDGIVGNEVSDKAIPTKAGNSRMKDGEIGCWRAHIDAIQEIVRRNISSALILEDDADWDVRIKEQFRDLALSSRALTQPLTGTASDVSYADSTYPSPPNPSAVPASDLTFDNLPSTIPPKSSPYGDHWDFIWVGHCGMRFPFLPGKDIPKGRVIQTDYTVPQHQYLRSWSSPEDIVLQYPNHTRAVHHVQDGTCSLGYAITQAAARNLLYSLGLNDVNAPYDLLLRQFCEGTGGRKYHRCLTIQPSLFHHHRPAGSRNAESDISDHGEDFRDNAETLNVRWSTRMNWQVLLDGRTDFVDQWPDAE